MTDRRPGHRMVAVTGLALACALGDDAEQVWDGVLQARPAQPLWEVPLWVWSS